MRRCEDNLADHYVGTGGLPNAQGVVELDASLMIGSTRRFGAVGALQGYPNPISVARAVLERLPQHSLLVGEGAALFAQECGFDHRGPADRRVARSCCAGRSPTVGRVASRARTPRPAAATSATGRPRSTWSAGFAPHDGPWGTINILALDASGELVRRRVHQRLPVEVPGPGRRLGAAGRGQLVRPAGRRRGLHRPRRAEHARAAPPGRSSTCSRRGRDLERRAGRRSPTPPRCPTTSAPSCGRSR